MRAQLAKTKIASEAMGVIQNQIAVNKNNNFQKRTANESSSALDDSRSTASANDRQTIYKPNLKKKPSGTNAAVSKPGITSQTKVSSNMVSGTVASSHVVMGGGSSNHRKQSQTRERGGDKVITSSVTRKQSFSTSASNATDRKQSTQKQAPNEGSRTAAVKDDKQNSTK